MTPPHTPESLLALTKSPKGLEKLRIIAAEADGWNDVHYSENWNAIIGTRADPGTNTYQVIPFLTTSLDAIFAAEERLGLHDRNNDNLRHKWWLSARSVFDLVYGVNNYVTDFAFLPPPFRLIPFVLTAQWKEQNP